MTLVYNLDDYIAEWVALRSPYAGINRGADWGKCSGVGIEVDGKLEAGVIYNNWNPIYGTIDLAIAADSPRWATRGHVREVLAVAFDRLGCQRATALVGQKNERAEKLVRGLGFKREGCARRAFGDQHALIFGMLKHEYEARYVKRR